MEFAIVVIMYDRGGEDEIERVLSYGCRAEAVDAVQGLATEIIKHFEWDNPEFNHEITDDGSTWSIDREPTFALAVRPIENHRRWGIGE